FFLTLGDVVQDADHAVGYSVGIGDRDGAGMGPADGPVRSHQAAIEIDAALCPFACLIENLRQVFGMDGVKYLVDRVAGDDAPSGYLLPGRIDVADGSAFDVADPQRLGKVGCKLTEQLRVVDALCWHCEGSPDLWERPDEA